MRLSYSSSGSRFEMYEGEGENPKSLTLEYSMSRGEEYENIQLWNAACRGEEYDSYIIAICANV